MSYICIGCAGFLLIHFFDVVSLKKWRRGVKPVTWVLGCGLLVYASIMACLEPSKLALPTWSVYPGWILLAGSLFLLVYALFVNLPFHRTYVAAGTSDKLITTGMYALVRHPGFYWFAIIMLSLVLVSGSKMMLIGAIIWTSADILMIVIQDKFVFTRMFIGYAKYQQETPMLVPNIRSLKAFTSSLKLFRA